MEKKEQNSPEEDAPGQEKRPGLMQAGAEMDGTETWSAEQALWEMARQTMRLESMQLQKSAQAQMEQTRRLEAAMTELTQRQRVDITSRTPDSAAGGMMGSCRRRMEVAGIASGPSQRSMQEISRFFERDARRYG